ncbi:hypothetical protein FA13DRAFT_1665254 [Coprinellus micaceus]|uniref:UBX domain-containing protein n=1 Tax=Coprinellus micaceus TaxID=71717 RepID=A0A4Y7T6L0_COPMI|nr:hypothetical protein FA13DRAFT_1665254 [Coprinellus micaceus]
MDAHLTDLQRSALESLLEVTGGECERDVAMSMLESVDWDVQKATEMIFDHPPPPRRPRSPPRTTHVHTSMEELEIDDDDQEPLLRPDRERGGHPVRGEAAPFLPYITRPLISILSLPFSLLSSLLRFVFGILRIPFPRFTGLTFISPLRRPPTREWSPERWLRELEEETGAVSLGRLKAQGRGAASGSEAGPSGSGLTSRGTGGLTIDGIQLDESKNYLPDFLLTTYEAALRETQRTSAILAVFLLSEEHDDTPAFKRDVLTNSTLLTTLSTHAILTWAAPTSSREGWSAAQKLGATSFPFVAFIALQPPRTSTSHSSHSSTPVLTVLSRHQGSSATTVEKLTSHIDDQVIPRVSTYLNRLKGQQRAREMERELRAQQDLAFAEAARKDRERIEARALEERRKADERRRLEEEAREAEEQQKREEEEEKRKEAERMEWRRWTRHTFVSSPQGMGKPSGQGLRIAVRLPTGTRLIHTFPANATMTDLYAFVDASLIPASLDPSSDPPSPPLNTPGSSSPSEILEEEVEDYPSPDEYWLFTLASSFPRVSLPWRPAAPLADVHEIKGGGQVVVEMVSNSRPESRVSRKSLESSGGEGDDDDSDDYKTESEDEE